RAKWGKLGGLAVALSDEKQSTKAWSSGAAGEAAVGARLDGLASESIRVMHDRRIPRSKANIDHIVVTPGGVWVIDAKRYVGKAPEKRVEGGVIRPRVELLMVKGRDKTALVEGMLKQVAHVREVVGDVPVYGVLCFVDADWGFFPVEFAVNGVQVVWPRKLASMITKLEEPVVDVALIAEQIARRFVRA
ncbi:MAG: nuclease-related domain-containing protein, partial [Microcella sp.]|nr:nuclease-related domain-containing protein [Microcella sp.]